MSGYIYVASSWRNRHQPALMHVLRAAGLDAYDFRHPEGATGFAWREVMPNYTPGSNEVLPSDYITGMAHPRAREGFDSDMAALRRADTCVLVLPCGRSAHLELGWAVGAGKRTAVLLDSPDVPMVPELMYGMVDYLAPDVHSLLGWLGVDDETAWQADL